MLDKYEFATEYILQECGSLSWWWLSKKWKRITAKRIARIIVDEATYSRLTPRVPDACSVGGTHDWPTEKGSIYTGACRKCGQPRRSQDR